MAAPGLEVETREVTKIYGRATNSVRKMGRQCPPGPTIGVRHRGPPDSDTLGKPRRFHRSRLRSLAGPEARSRPYLPELPNPFAARAEASRLSTSSTAPVSTGTGIICAILSPAWSCTAASPRLVMSTRISPR